MQQSYASFYGVTDGRTDARTPNGSLSLPSPPVGSTKMKYLHYLTLIRTDSTSILTVAAIVDSNTTMRAVQQAGFRADTGNVIQEYRHAGHSLAEAAGNGRLNGRAVSQLLADYDSIGDIPRVIADRPPRLVVVYLYSPLAG